MWYKKMIKQERNHRKWLNILKAAKPILLSHHPACKKFESHTITLRGKKICLGCLVIYPTIIITLSLLFMFDIILNQMIGWYLFPLGLLFLSSKIISAEKRFKKIQEAYQQISAQSR